MTQVHALFCFFRTFVPVPIFRFKLCRFYDEGTKIFLAPGRRVP